MITPTIGRVVWFWPNHTFPGVNGDSQPLVGLIAHVWSDSCVNLAVFDANGHGFGQTSVLLVQEGSERPQSYFCEWMPYQKGQAAKTEQLQQALQNKASDTL